MKRLDIFLTTLLSLLLVGAHQSATAATGAGVYIGSEIFESGTTSVSDLRQSGNKWVCVWTIHIYPNADLHFNEALIVQNHKYVGGSKAPDLAKNIAMLKTQPTSIEWVEVGLSGWGSGSFDTVRDLVKTEGTGPNSKLYRSFKALRDAIPDIDAFSIDDEKTYHEPSTTQFAIMLADLGFKVSICPYTQPKHWENVVKNTNQARPGTIEDVHLQCYCGGAGNSPCKWKSYFASDINIMPGFVPASDVGVKIANWNKQCGLQGGWIWSYETMGDLGTVKSYAQTINDSVNGGGSKDDNETAAPATMESPAASPTQP